MFRYLSKMKRYLSSIVFILLCFTLLSWGFKGHRIIATIAENHLTPQAKSAIKDLLGTQSLADVSTWADELRDDPQYKSTANWHFININPGLNFNQFSEAVKSQSKENLYTAFNKSLNDLKSVATSKQQKIDALKFLVHFVGDIHQPMHVSRAEDKGGNTIQVQFYGKGTNLHTLWDSRLLDHQGLEGQQLVDKLESQIKLPRLPGYNNDVMRWLFTSYKTSTTLYAEVEKNNKLDDEYYNSHLKIVNDNLSWAGVRLAGVLNDIFKNGHIVFAKSNGQPNTSAIEPIEPKPVPDTLLPPGALIIQINEGAKHLGKYVSFTAKAYSTKDMGSMILVNLGAAYPNQLLTVVLRGEAKAKGANLDGKEVKVIGNLIDHKGKPEIIVTDPKSFTVVESVNRPGVSGG
jgi:hypothetical protein